MERVRESGKVPIIPRYKIITVTPLIYAAYDKLNTILGTPLPLTAAEQVNQEVLALGAASGSRVNLIGHSRGGMTIANALQDAANHGIALPSLSSVRLSGSAANAQHIADLGARLSDGAAMTYQSTHVDDWLVSRPLGANPPTGGIAGKGPLISHITYSNGPLPPGYQNFNTWNSKTGASDYTQST